MPLSEVGPYRLLRLLKSGGEASVYIAEDRRLGRRVAVKILPLSDDARRRRATLEDARKLAALAHPLIVQIYDVVELPDSLALVLEYVDGNDLEQLLSVAELDVATVLQLGQDLCTALAAAHAAGIAHGDLKPANVLINHEGAPRLTDFGTGTSASALSPEQLAGESPGPAADMFALGCLLYRLLSGVHPFGGDLAGSGEEAPGLQEQGIAVPEALDRLVMELLEPNPNRRPDAALDVRQRLLSIARDNPAGSNDTLASASRSLDVSGSAQASNASLSPAGPPTAAIPLPLIVVTAAGLLALAALWWWPTLPISVQLETTQIRGEAEHSVAELDRLLAQALERDPVLEIVPVSDSERLHMEVSCNEAVCVTQLVRTRGPEERSDTRSLLPASGELAWRRRIEQGLQELYAD